MKVTAVIFSWAPDYLSTGYAVRALVRLGVRVVVAVDWQDAVPVIEGAEVVVTDFPRHGNLNGKACVEGILATMDAVGRADDEWVIKVDADAVVMGMGWLAGVTERVEVVGSRYDGQALYGFCYAVRRVALVAMRRRARALPESDDCPEDCTVGGLAESHWLWKHLEADCPMAAYAWDERPEERWRKEYEVVVFQRILGHGRRDVARKMKQFVEMA